MSYIRYILRTCLRVKREKKIFERAWILNAGGLERAWILNAGGLLTLILPTPKMIVLCHQHRARPACTSVQSDQDLYCWLANFKFSS